MKITLNQASTNYLSCQNVHQKSPTTNQAMLVEANDPQTAIKSMAELSP